jgi:hypothetical protein
MATGIATTLLTIDPNNELAKGCLNRIKTRHQVTPERRPPQILSHSQNLPGDWLSAKRLLESGYTSLKVEAHLLQEEIRAIQALGETFLDGGESLSKLQAISQGSVSSAVSMAQPVSIRELAKIIMETPEKCQELIIADFEEFVLWGSLQSPPIDLDETRERLVKRKTLLEAALPVRMTPLCASALFHIESLQLSKKYVNDETMLGDKIEDIPRDKVLVTEDNYIWDMDELTQALAVGGGTMRNPLSKHMFTASDIRMILAHPVGRQLKAMHVEQNQMKKGVRPATISRIENLGKIMKNFQELDTSPLREHMDEFEGYCLTLSEAEQKTIKALKIPATDGFNGQAFDYTISQSLQDAKANVTCFHKVFSMTSLHNRGRFLTQYF